VVHYDRLREARSRYAAAEASGGWPDVPVGPVAEHGDSSDVVAALRERLVAGANARERSLALRGRSAAAVFDSSLVRAVRHYQDRHRLKLDGVFGPETARELNVPAGQRVIDLELNLDRLRWMPRDLGDRAILVNVAGFRLVLFEDHWPAKTMDVVVGRPAWKTAIFGDRMTHVIFNPYWHVPESIEAADILPRVKRNPSYLREKKLEVVRQDRPFGPPVDRSFDWPSVEASSFPYDFRQSPGPHNALGRVKFMFPNRFAIYLHDTPADQLFDRRYRAFSHGCIRVARPLELARYLFRETTERSPSEVGEILESRERTRVELDTPVNVYVTYFTTWVDEDGDTWFHPDIYDRDPEVATAGVDGASVPAPDEDEKELREQ